MSKTTYTEISRADEAERRLRVLEDEIQQLVYGLSHDLREPLRMVTSFLDLLDKQYRQQAGTDADEYIDYAMDGARRAEAMLDGLLELSRVVTNRGEPVPLSAEESLFNVAGAMRLKYNQADAKINVHRLPVIRFDATQWDQLWRHLLDNAFKFRAADRALGISVSVEEAEKEWQFFCRDNGIGIDPEQSERIFMPFKRLHAHGEYDGIGMGLPVCRRIVECHGGQMGCDTSVSEGCLIWFTVPKPA